ncbi:MAG: HNH endonuclease [Sulfuricaulis sp.]
MSRQRGSVKDRHRRVARLMERHNGCCVYCLRPVQVGARNQPLEATMDHIIPASKGGRYSLDNLVLACRECNTARGNKSQIKFFQMVAA